MLFENLVDCVRIIRTPAYEATLPSQNNKIVLCWYLKGVSINLIVPRVLY